MFTILNDKNKNKYTDFLFNNSLLYSKFFETLQKNVYFLQNHGLLGKIVKQVRNNTVTKIEITA